jgi:hypothetical protein
LAARVGDRAKFAAGVRAAAEKGWPPHGIIDRLIRATN